MLVPLISFFFATSSMVDEIRNTPEVMKPNIPFPYESGNPQLSSIGNVRPPSDSPLGE
jgi:hypothetical protein